jgi:hypothetical protein
MDLRELKQAGAERAKNDQAYYIARAVTNWDRENAPRLSKLRGLADCGASCPPGTGDEMLKLDGDLHESVPKLLAQIRAVPIATCDTAFAQRVQTLFDTGASDRKPMTIKADAKCTDGKLQLSTMTNIETKTMQTGRSDRME